MIGGIIGDIIGSKYEFQNIKTKDFPLFSKYCDFTDDSILTVATADWLLHGGEVAKYYSIYAADNDCPMGGYGSGFRRWITRTIVDGDFSPYNSCGNGSAMRVGPVGWLSIKIPLLNEKLILNKAKESAECTHNHPEGIKGAQATALCRYLARKGTPVGEIRRRIEKDFSYDLSMSVEELRPRYSWQGLDEAGNGGTCQGSVPQAIICALEAKDFEDAVRNAISIGGDSDTIGCITGSIAEALYGIPNDIRQKGLSYLPNEFKKVIDEFEDKFGNK
jgi:ADP-ribosylglycohydrolase